MKFLIIFSCSILLLTSCNDEVKVNERQLLIEELYNDIVSIKGHSVNFQNYLNYMGKDMLQMYPNIKNKISKTRTTMDSIIQAAKNLKTVDDVNLFYKISLKELEQNVLFNNILPDLYSVNQLFDIELIKLYREREVERAFFDVLQAYEHPHNTEEQFKQYQYLKEKFKGYKEE